MERLKQILKKRNIIILIVLVIAIAILAISYLEEKEEIEEKIEPIYFILYKDEKMGIIDTEGNIIVHPYYDSIQIPNPEKDIFICKKENETIALNKSGEVILKEYKELEAIQKESNQPINPYYTSVLIYKKNNKLGLIDLNGKILTKPIYDEIKGFENKNELLVKQNDKYGVITTKGNKKIETQYTKIKSDKYYIKEKQYQLSGYIVEIKTNERYRYGYFNYQAKEILEPKYTDIYRINEITEEKDIYLIVADNGQYGVTKNKKKIIDFNYQAIEYNATNKLFLVKRNIKYGVLNKIGETILKNEYNQIYFDSKYIYVGKQDEYDIYDVTGEKIENKSYKCINITTNKQYYITVDQDEMYGILDKNENILVENKYLYLEYLFENYFIASEEKNKFGVIDEKGNILIEFQYEALQLIKDTTILQAKKIQKEEVDLYNIELKKIISVENPLIEINEEYIKIYTSDDGIKYYNKKGQELEVKDIFKNNIIFTFEENGKWGYKDKQQNIIVPAEYEYATQINKYGYGGIKKDGKWGVIDKNGTIILEPIYEILDEIEEVQFIKQYRREYYKNGEYYYTDIAKK